MNILEMKEEMNNAVCTVRVYLGYKIIRGYPLNTGYDKAVLAVGDTYENLPEKVKNAVDIVRTRKSSYEFVEV